MSFVGIWSGLCGNLVGPSWKFGRAFVGIWSGLRGNLVGFVEIWSGSSGAIQRPPKVFMDFQVCSGIWFKGGVWIIRMSFGSMAGVARRDVLKAEKDIPNIVGIKGRVGTFPIRDVNRSDSKHDLEMLNPKP